MIHKCKSIKEIYNETKGFDLVITPNVSLCSALNSRIEGPRLGLLAVTPKELASKYSPTILKESLLDEFELALYVAKELGLSIKQAHYHVNRVLNAWEDVGSIHSLRKLLTKSEDVLNIVSSLPTLQLVMERFNPDVLKGLRIAVVGLEFFRELDKSILPKDYVKVELFIDEPYYMPKLYLFSGEEELVNKLVSLIDRANANDVAIILDLKSSYFSNIKTRLLSKDIPVVNKMLLRDSFVTRRFLKLIDIGLNPGELTVKEAITLAEFPDVNIQPEYANYLLSEYVSDINTCPELKEIYEFSRNITNLTYKDILRILSEKGTELPTKLYEILDLLGIADKRPDFESYSDLAYIVENHDVEIGKVQEGVMFVDCKELSFVDRPICFMIGLDTSWGSTNSSEWMNKSQRDNIALKTFQILLQQGQIRNYMVSLMKDNQPVVPCYCFNELFGKEIESFCDPIFTYARVRHEGSFIEKPQKSHRARFYDVRFMSESSLNKFILCPRQYAYDKLTYYEDKEDLIKGNLLHEYATLYFNFPEKCNELGDDFFVKEMLNSYTKMARDIKAEVFETIFRVGIQNIRNFIDNLVVDQNIRIDAKMKPVNDNRFFSLLGLSPEKPNAELEFEDKDIHIRGRFDLIVNNATIVDYKSSSKKRSCSEIIRSAFIELAKDDVDLQPLVYILEMRKLGAGTVELLYNFVLNEHEKVIDGCHNDTNIAKVRYIDLTFNDFLQTPEGIDAISSAQKRREIVDKIGYEAFVEFFKQNPIPLELQFDKQKICSSEYRERFEEFIKRKSRRKAEVDGFLKAIVDLRTGSSRVGNEPVAMFFKDDLDKFENLIEQKLREMELYINDRFPAKPLNSDVCKRCDYADMCSEWLF